MARSVYLEKKMGQARSKVLTASFCFWLTSDLAKGLEYSIYVSWPKNAFLWSCSVWSHKNHGQKNTSETNIKSHQHSQSDNGSFSTASTRSFTSTQKLTRSWKDRDSILAALCRLRPLVPLWFSTLSLLSMFLYLRVHHIHKLAHSPIEFCLSIVAQ